MIREDSNNNYNHDPISKLNDAPDQLLTNYDNLLLISRQTSESNIFTSRKVNLSSISENLWETIVEIPEFKPTGKWFFNDGLSVDTKIIKQEQANGNLNCVVNAEYVSTLFLSAFSQLSNEIYSKNHIPSSVGEIIFSTNRKFRTEAGVKAYYGQNTTWEQITGRFIQGYDGSDSKLKTIGKRGGEIETTLTIDHIPKHSHKFVPSTDKKTFVASFSLTAGDNEQSVLGKGTFHARTQDGEVDPTLYAAKTESQKPDAKLETAGELYGEDKKSANVYVKENQYNGKPHSNMPPFYAVYIWRRVS